MKKLVSLLVVALLVLMVTPVLAAGHETITDIVVASAEADPAEFTILKAALLEADLADALAGDGPFTVFAPTDAAFGDLLTALDITADQLLAHPQLADVLLYHVVGAEAMSGDLSDGDTFETLQGEDITIKIDGGVYVNEDSEVIDADIDAANGVIHVIDKVLVPEAFVLTTDTITDIVVASADADPAEFTILEAALIKAGLTDALAGDGPFTVFAPTDAAFTALLTALDITAEQLLNHPQLSEVLLYHVVGAKAMSTDLSDGDAFETLQGEEVTIAINGGVSVNDAKVTTADIEAQNGVIHVIDKVLVPDSFVLSTDTVVGIALGNDDFSILVAALQKAGLVDTLNGEGPFTVFAPTNEAFADLLEALDITAEQLLNQPDLAKVLLYHVISGKVMSTDLEDGMEAATLNGQMVIFDLMSDMPMVNESGIIMTDLEAQNGVVHVIDAVLVPDDFTLQLEEEEEEEVPETGSNNTLPVAAAMLILGLGSLTLGKVLSKGKAK